MRSVNWSERSWQREHARRDDRLLRDVGLGAEEAFGPSAAFWSEWRNLREPWQL